MKNVQRVIAATALLGFAGMAGASELQMCLYPQDGNVLSVTLDVLGCMINALIQPA